MHGKPTIVKQMKKIHETLTNEDIKIMAPYIQDAVVGYIKLLCFQCQELHAKEECKTKVEHKNESVRQQMLNLHSPYDLTQALATKITTLWADVCYFTYLSLRFCA